MRYHIVQRSLDVDGVMDRQQGRSNTLTGADYYETKDVLAKEIRFKIIICLRSISKVFPDFVYANKQFEMF
ncbi:hypothetical protein Goklo_002205 [Gossypium klotzschianum]|uniref:Uncharacterized protein n=1 Tax=Gossypium klotzschianum TaxID=34286 RepID=A0A7J8VSY4_9ROSI|nr:hypothetical protein [Gossypium klotzschianum]